MPPESPATVGDVERWLAEQQVERGTPVAVATRVGVGLGLATATSAVGFRFDDPVRMIAHIESVIGPRWVWWDRATADDVARAAEIDRCWDVLTVDRLLRGGWRTSIATCWAWLENLPEHDVPSMGQLDLLGEHEEEGDPAEPVRPDGHLRPEWIAGGWAADPTRMAGWARVAMGASIEQQRRLAARPLPERVVMTARSESVAEFLCAELERHGLPLDVDAATRIIGDAIGPRPRDERHADELRRERDEQVLRHLDDPAPPIDLRNPADVKSMLRRIAVDVPDTRAWRLERHRDHHPLVPALLAWRKAERIATTYGYRWLDEHIRDGRLTGAWSSSDGAAGRMTASSGLHNLPAEMRAAVVAEPGHRFVRADLGQIEPRILAAVSGDEALIAATADDDLYQPVAQRLQVERDIAKVAVLGAMYGATTGESAHALRGLERAYPVAMGYLEAAAEAGRAGDDVFTIGGRRVRMWFDDSIDGDIDRGRRVAASRGRFARNAVIQGAAAEFFKMWAVIVRMRGRPAGARIVLCLHDELLVHVPEESAPATVELLREALDEAAFRWSPCADVRFLADASVIGRWSDAKS